MIPPSRFKKDGSGTGDDGFVFSNGNKTFTVSSDISLENTHFSLKWTKPHLALRKALLSNLSDINAMGGSTKHILLNIGASKNWNKRDFSNFGEVLRDMEKKFGFCTVGGDLVRSSSPGFFSITAIGQIKGNPLLRSNALPGHKIYHTGELGTADCGLKLLSENFSGINKNIRDYCISRYHLPEVPLELGPVLSRIKGKTAAIDISDGLSSELWHISKQSNCRMIIDWKKIGFFSGINAVLGKKRAKYSILHGGEDYQLLFTGSFSPAQLKRINQVVKVYEIGRVSKGKGVFLATERGIRALKPSGWAT